jgi:hypothetical protein
MRTEISFALVGPFSHLIIVPVSVNGQGPFRFGLDTGGAHSTISTALAQRLALEEKEHIESFGVGSSIPLTMSAVESLSLGQAIVRDVPVAVADLSAFERRLETHLDGILAFDYLQHFILTIDYPHRQLGLEDEHGSP